MPARDLAARTRLEYKNDLSDLIEFLTKRGITRLDQVTLQHLVLWDFPCNRLDIVVPP